MTKKGSKPRKKAPPKPTLSRQAQQAQAQAKQRQRRAGASSNRGSSPTAEDALPSSTAPPSTGSTAEPTGTTVTDGLPPSPSRASWCYVDVGAGRVQDWLDRTPLLRARRGASYLLAEATSPEQVNAALAAAPATLPHGLEWNEETGAISGVASVRYPGTAEETGGHQTAAAVATVLANHVRRQAPSIPVQASWGVGPSYLEAYEDMRRRDVAEPALIRQPLVGCESPTTRPCDLCQVAPATHADVALPPKGKAQQLCEDCHARVVSPAFTENVDLVGPTPGFSSARDHIYLPRSQRDLHRHLSAGLTCPLGRFPADFAELARVYLSADDAETHLACLYGDGNRVGAMLAAYAKSVTAPSEPGRNGAGGAVPKSEVVIRLDRATKGAILHATATVLPWRAQTIEGKLTAPPVIVHLADGDDILVSVPAPYAWPFVRALTGSFDAATAELAEMITPAPDGDRDEPRLPGQTPIAPSLSVGMVFHHQNEPFADVVARAGTMLKHAKRDVRGRGASVRFLDMTADGPAPIGSRVTLTMADIEAQCHELDALAAVPASQRANLVTLLRAVEQGDAPRGVRSRSGGDAPPETPEQTLVRRVLTMGTPAVTRIVAGPDATDGSVRTALLGNSTVRSRLRTALDIARWWPVPTRGHPAPEPNSTPQGQDPSEGPAQ